MKKFLLTLVLLVGMVFGLMAQKLTYQAVVRDNNQQLVTNTAVKATVTIDFTGDQADYDTTITDVSTNIHGLLSFEFGGKTLNGRDWTGATIAVKVVNKNDESIVYVNGDARPVSAVPYALSVDGQSIRNYLTEHHYVDLDKLNDTLGAYSTTAAMDARHYLRSDSTVITTMQGNITSLQSGLSAAIGKEKTDSTTLAGRIDALEGAAMDCNKVKECIKDTLSKYTVTDVLNGLLQQLEARLTGKIDSLARIVDSLSNLTPGGGDDPATFTCGTDKVQDTDGNEYNTVQIGNQCWMAQNLRTKIGGDGDKGYPTEAGNDTVTCGRLYTWSAMMKGAPSTNYPAGTTAADTIVHGICPAGWHVPSNAEWDTLTTYFSGSFGGFGGAECWSATQYNDDNACGRILGSNGSDVASFIGRKYNGYSVRCLRDPEAGGGDTPGGDEPTPCTPTSSTHNIEIYTSQLPYAFGDTIFQPGTTAGTYTLHRTNVGGCDSTITINLSFFTCGTSKVKDVDLNEYNTVVIGNQCWMKENLRTTKYANGTAIAKGTDTSTTTAYRYYPNNDSSKVSTYGYLYNWKAVMDTSSSSKADPSGVQGICPIGWHVPSNAEWIALIDYVKSMSEYQCDGSADNIANALSQSTGWNSSTSEGCNAGNMGDKANATGFSAVPAGFYYIGGYKSFGTQTVFWSATLFDSANAFFKSLISSVPRVDQNSVGLAYGLSVRCLRD